MRDLIGWWKTDTKHVMIQAPTGTGKTVLHLLFALLKLDSHRVIYFSREHAQIEQCTYELNQLIEHNPDADIRAVHIAGKAHSCLHSYVRDMDDLEAQDIACEEYTSSVCGYDNFLSQPRTTKDEVLTLSSHFKDVFYSFDMLEEDRQIIDETMVEVTPKDQIIDELFQNKIATNEIIMEVAEKYSTCPRTLQNWAMENANIIFAPYNYMIIPRFEPDPDNDLYIIDEAHNLDSNLTSMYSYGIARKTIINYLNYIRNKPTMAYLNPLNDKVIQPLLRYNEGDSEYSIYDDDLSIFLNGIDIDDISMLSQLLEEIVDKSTKVRKYGGDKSDKVPKYFKSMLRFTEVLIRLKDNHKSGYITYSYGRYEINFVDTNMIFNSISKQADRIIISSGSLYPKYMAAYLGLNRKNLDIFEYNPPHKNRFNIASVVASYNGVKLNSRWKNRKPRTYDAYTDIIEDVYHENDEGTLVYFTSYAYRDEIGKRLDDRGIPYYEPGDVDQYRADLRDGKSAVFMSAFRGLGSEGWNFGDEQSRAIILIGIPYLPIRDIGVKAQRKYYDSRKKGLGVAWYNQKAVLWLMQSFGRGLRHKDDYTTIYFVDNRIGKMRRYFLDWVKKATNWKMVRWENRRKIRNEMW